jgi:ribosomal protein L11 methyltransferase
VGDVRVTSPTSAYERQATVLVLEVAAEDAEAMAAELAARWGREPVQVLRPHHPMVWIELYFHDEVQAMLARAAMRGDTVRSTSLRPSVPADWQAMFQRQFTAREIGARLRICPVWEQDIVPEDHRVNLWVDPGLSFGTGNHFTTSFCLERMDQLWFNSPPSSFLDVGTGSGILAIAAAALGCERVVAFDADEAVLPYTRENIGHNQVSSRVDLRCLDVRFASFGESFDIICANLYGGLLLDCAPALVRWCGRNLIISGIRDVEVEGVADAFVAAGAQELVRDGDGEWAGLMFETKAAGVRS